MPQFAAFFFDAPRILCRLTFAMKLILATFIIVSIAPFADAQNPRYYSQQPIPGPKIFGEGIISAGDYESHAEFSVTGDTVYFVKSAPDLSKWTICVSYFKNNAWTAPEVASFSGTYWDADPFITKDGKEFYFISNRPLHEGEPAKDFDIWKMTRTSSGWSAPVRLPDVINSPESEYYPTLTDNGTLYFGSRRKGGKGAADIYRSVLKNNVYQAAENLGDAINTEGSEFEPFISRDETYLIFMAARPDHLDYADLYVSYNKNGNWTVAQKLPEPFNSSVTEFSPKVSRDGRYFFFASTRNTNQSVKKETTADMNKRLKGAGNGLGDIYQTDISALKIQAGN